MKSIATTLLVLCLPALATGQLAPKEKKIIESVDANLKQELELLKTAVNINSGTMNFDGVKEVGDLFIKEFKNLGFETRWSDGVNFNRAGHLIATYKGKKNSPKLLLIGHLDTVFEPNSPLQEYKMVNDSVMKGPGVVDMKGGDVMIIYALKALKEANVLSNLTVEVVMTGDEEKSGRPLSESKKDLIEAAQRADIAIGFENGDSNPKTAVVSRRGSIGWTLEVTGQPAHSSQVFTEKVGVGAIYEASRILNDFYRQLSKEENLTFNPGMIVGGTEITTGESGDDGTAFGKSNVVAQTVYVKGDLRAVSLDQLARAKEAMQQIAAENYPKTSASITFSEGYPPLSPSGHNDELLRIYSKASEDLGFGTVAPVNPRNAGAADVSFTAGHVEKAMDGLGLSGGKDHTVDEYGNINMLPVLTKRAAIFLYRLSL